MMIGRTTWRERLLPHIPYVLIEWPFEVLMAVSGIVSGPPVMLGLTSRRSFATELPLWLDLLLGGTLLLGGLTLAYGLACRRYRTSVPRGLHLMGMSVLSFAAVIAIVGGLRTLPSLPLVTVLGMLCLLRAFLLTTQWQMARRIMQVADRS